MEAITFLTAGSFNVGLAPMLMIPNLGSGLVYKAWYCPLILRAIALTPDFSSILHICAVFPHVAPLRPAYGQGLHPLPGHLQTRLTAS